MYFYTQLLKKDNMVIFFVFEKSNILEIELFLCVFTVLFLVLSLNVIKDDGKRNVFISIF